MNDNLNSELEKIYELLNQRKLDHEDLLKEVIIIVNIVIKLNETRMKN